jgi:hypothetical protein
MMYMAYDAKLNEKVPLLSSSIFSTVVFLNCKELTTRKYSLVHLCIPTLSNQILCKTFTKFGFL